MTIHDVIAKLTTDLNLTPEQQFRVTALIKRYVHSEKASVFHRYFLYSQGGPIFEGEGEDRKVVGHESPRDPWLNKILKAKYEQHQEMASKFSDEELVTWSVGSHTYRQIRPPCKCGKDSIAVQSVDGVVSYFCREHIPADFMKD